MQQRHRQHYYHKTVNLPTKCPWFLSIPVATADSFYHILSLSSCKSVNHKCHRWKSTYGLIMRMEHGMGWNGMKCKEMVLKWGHFKLNNHDRSIYPRSDWLLAVIKIDNTVQTHGGRNQGSCNMNDLIPMFCRNKSKSRTHGLPLSVFLLITKMTP